MSSGFRIGRWAGLAALLALAACDLGRAPEQGNGPAPAPPPGNELVETDAKAPPAEPELDRESLLIAAVRARSAAAIGTDAREVQRALDGRRFTFRIRLGCTLAQSETDEGVARYDPALRRVVLTVAPDLTDDDPVAAAMAGDDFEASEGFWIRDPWLLAPHCAAGQAGAPPVGIAQFFTADEPRAARRSGRPYEAREEFREGEAPEAGDWELVFTGRLQRLGDGRVIQCRESVPGTPPACIISARFDLVEIVNRRRGSRLAEWRAG